jgi:hypothetical protein
MAWNILATQCCVDEIFQFACKTYPPFSVFSKMMHFNKTFTAEHLKNDRIYCFDINQEWHETVKEYITSFWRNTTSASFKFIYGRLAATQPILHKSEQICSRFVTTCCQQADIWMRSLVVYNDTYVRLILQRLSSSYRR